MKKVKKLLSFLLALTLVLGLLPGTVSAAGTSTFGSSKTALSAGTYYLPVSLMSASNITSTSPAGACIKSAYLTVESDGSASVVLNLSAISMAGITASATDWKIYTDYENKTLEAATVLATDSDGAATKISFPVYDTTADGVYVNMYVAAMGYAPDAYLSLQYADIGKTYTYTNTCHVIAFGGYDLTVEVSVKDGVISGISVEGSAYDGKYAALNQEYSESAIAGMTDGRLEGLDATDADAINSVDTVSGATVSSQAIISAVLEALGLEVEEEELSVLSSVPAAGTYTVDIAYITDVVDHDIIGDANTTATLVVGKDGTMTLTTVFNNATNGSGLFITGFNGYYKNNDTTGKLLSKGVTTKTATAAYSDTYFPAGSTVVKYASFPLTGDLCAIYSTNVSIYVPKMNALNGEISGITFENGHFSVDAYVTVYWDTLSAVKGNTYTVGNYTYKVTGKKTVTLTGVAKTSLKSIVVPATVKIAQKSYKVTAIGKKAFSRCTKATKVTIGKNVKKIGENAFSGIVKTATITAASSKVKKLLTAKTGVVSTMTVKVK